MQRWDKINRQLILASSSPRRKEILKRMGLKFIVKKPRIENENKYIITKRIKESIQNLAYLKAKSISSFFKSSLVIGCDTIVMIDKQVMGKPESSLNAKVMLKQLSGRKHKVYSGIALICGCLNFTQTAVASTDVFFRDVLDSEINDYLKENEFRDKAGAYAIQGKAMTFIKKINGCFYNVMGLPISETITLFNTYMEFLKGQK